MTWVKKMSSNWEPQEHPGLRVGESVDFPGNVEQLLKEGNVVLCDEDGNEISAYDRYGIVTNRELDEFKEYKKMQGQIALGKKLESQRDALLAEAAKLKEGKIQDTSGVESTGETTEETQVEVVEIDAKKKALRERLAKARAARKVGKSV